MDKRKNFIAQKRESFLCRQCGTENSDMNASPRNHCFQCLHSIHVDQDVPGDRASICGGIMKPMAVDQDGKKGLIIVHQCLKCQKFQRNKAAVDDDMDRICEVMKAVSL